MVPPIPGKFKVYRGADEGSDRDFIVLSSTNFLFANHLSIDKVYKFTKRFDKLFVQNNY